MAEKVQQSLVTDLREYVMDSEEYNLLNLGEVELENETLEGAIRDGLHRYNLILPLSSKTIVNVVTSTSADGNGQLWHVVKKAAAIEAVQKMIFRNIRNQADVNDMGFISQENNKAPLWRAMKKDLMDDFESVAKQYKRGLEYAVFTANPVSISMHDDRTLELGTDG
ncbi:hypothetical protein LCGC14_2878920 [marine sediment metagenome]|uniref:Uncharacterized protein n=1 Tax=marine sediment metagenome TaxID=412755 RepID=A0A0F9ARW5_9ZZZZ